MKTRQFVRVNPELVRHPKIEWQGIVRRSFWHVESLLGVVRQFLLPDTCLGRLVSRCGTELTPFLEFLRKTNPIFSAVISCCCGCYTPFPIFYFSIGF